MFVYPTVSDSSLLLIEPLIIDLFGFKGLDNYVDFLLSALARMQISIHARVLNEMAYAGLRFYKRY